MPGTGGCLRRTGRVLTESRILSCRSRTELAIPLPSSRSYFAPSRTPWMRRAHRSGSRPRTVSGAGSSGGGAGYRPRVLKRYYEPVINLTISLHRGRERSTVPFRDRPPQAQGTSDSPECRHSLPGPRCVSACAGEIGCSPPVIGSGRGRAAGARTKPHRPAPSPCRAPVQGDAPDRSARPLRVGRALPAAPQDASSIVNSMPRPGPWSA